MSGWIVWLLVACGFAVGEVTLTAGFWLAPFALGAGAGAILDAAGVGEPFDFILFVVCTVTALVSLRPIVASRLISSTPTLRTGGAALVGQHGVVLEPIVNHQGTVKVGGEVWTARSFDAQHEIPAGADVEIVEIKGATALVME